jgi:predicted RNase H-like HicB family nuclease
LADAMVQTNSEVFKQLCEIVDEWIEIYKKDNLELPKPLSINEIYGEAASAR